MMRLMRTITTGLIFNNNYILATICAFQILISISMVVVLLILSNYRSRFRRNRNPKLTRNYKSCKTKYIVTNLYIHCHTNVMTACIMKAFRLPSIPLTLPIRASEIRKLTKHERPWVCVSSIVSRNKLEHTISVCDLIIC